jgi:molybdopterin/thiamine biosynthesis adenylyltransferase/rhodanese-related sulfurtransferase
MYNDSYQETIEQARSLIHEVPIDEAYNLLRAWNNVTFLDIREPEELALGYIKGSVFIRADELEMQAKHLLPDKNAPIILYCGEGIRSLMMGVTLKELGYTNVRNLTGGIEAWKEAGYDVVTDGLLTLDQLTYYSRQIILSEVGIEGQKKLLESRMLLVGAGGLGSSIGLYLAASGIGTLGIIDFDRVEKSNLNRQILHGFSDIGKLKVDSAKEAILHANPDVNVITFNEKIVPENALNIVQDFDIVLDGSDNFPTKYLLNDASFFAEIPYIFGAAVQFYGQAGVFYPKEGGPCLRCMIPIPPEDELVPT